MFIEQGFNLLQRYGVLNYIVPLPIVTSESMTALHKLLLESCETIKVSNYAKRPMQIFASACTANSIFSFIKTNSENKNILISKLNRLNKNNSLEKLFQKLSFIDCKEFCLFGRFPKINCQIEKNILKKLFSKTNSSIKDLVVEKGKAIYYRTSGGRYFNVITNYSTGSTQEKSICFNKKNVNSIGACLSSSLFWWFQQIYTDTLHLKIYEMNHFTIPNDLISERADELEKMYSNYLLDIEQNANVIQTQKYVNVTSFKEYKIRKSKHLIDQIDDLICPLYGLTQEETDFIKNYEIEFRLSDND